MCLLDADLRFLAIGAGLHGALQGTRGVRRLSFPGEPDPRADPHPAHPLELRLMAPHAVLRTRPALRGGDCGTARPRGAPEPGAALLPVPGAPSGRRAPSRGLPYEVSAARRLRPQPRPPARGRRGRRAALRPAAAPLPRSFHSSPHSAHSSHRWRRAARPGARPAPPPAGQQLILRGLRPPARGNLRPRYK